MSRLGTLIRRTQSFRSSNAFVGIPKFRFFSDVTDGESPVYHHARLFKKPLSVPFKLSFANSVKVMGFVDRPIRVLDTGPGNFGVSTLLRVKDPLNPNRSFRISLRMWDEIARTCIAHLKPNDHIFVSGRLESYSKSSSNEHRDLDLEYKVRVTELNYVMAPRSHVVDSQIASETAKKDGIEELKNNQIRMWKDLFANPYDWRDQRKTKKNPRQPDFKHKKSGEALWLESDQPVWVNRQLELFDKRKAEDGCNDDEIYLWQVFLANPDDWWDDRRSKKNPKQPDFKNKNTDEALWLGPDLPDWVTRQLELLDQRRAENSRCYGEEQTRHSSFSEWL